MDCPGATFLDLYRLFLRLSNTLTHLKLEYTEELLLDPSQEAHLLPSVLNSFTLRAPSPEALVILNYFRLCPFAEFRLLGAPEVQPWRFLRGMARRLGEQ